MGKQRKLSSEQILYLLINLREQEAKRDIYTDIKVNSEKCKEIGMISYKMKATGEKKQGALFLISETHNGEDVTLIYDENGKFIAWQNEDKKINVAKDLELNEEQLQKQLEIGEERTINSNSSDSSSDTTKGGEGRDKADKEHEDEQENKEKDDKKENLNDNNQQLVNLRDLGITVYGKPLIRLDKPINGAGQDLFNMLHLRSKLGNKMPKGVNIESFRQGYFTYVNSEELTAKDGKERKTPETPVIVTRDEQQIIELDESIIEPQEMGTITERRKIEQSKVQFNEFGEEEKRPTFAEELMVTSRFRIVDDYNLYGPDEKFISIQKMREEVLHGTKDTLRYDREIYFERVDREEGLLERKNEYKSYSEELQPVDRELRANKDDKETKHEKGLENYEKTSEAREKSFEELAAKILNKNEELKDVFNLRDVTNMVKELYPECKDEEEIEEKIVENGEQAKDIEHEFYLYGRDRRGQ